MDFSIKCQRSGLVVSWTPAQRKEWNKAKERKDDGRFRSDQKKHSGKREELKASLEACRNRGPC